MSMTLKTSRPRLLILLLLAQLSILSWAQTTSDAITADYLCRSNTSNLSSTYSQCLNDTPDYESCPDPTLCESQTTRNNVGLAFGLTIGAGLATTLGAILPFVPFIKRSNTRYLAVGLSLAAGVMIYVSFTEILTKSRYNFCCATQKHYELAATLCFFGGIFLTVLLDLLVWFLQKLDCGCCSLRGWKSCCARRRLSPSTRRKTVIKGETLTTSNNFHLTQLATNHVSKEELILPPQSSFSSTPTAYSLPESSEEVEMELENITNNVLIQQEFESGDRNHSVLSPPLGHDGLSRDSESRLQSTCTPDEASVSVMSTTLSENTNNYTNASINELFSNSSLLRMNACIPETASLSLPGELVAQSDSKTTSSSGTDSLSVTVGVGERCDGLRRRHSYQEMVDQKHDSCEEALGPEEFKEVTQVVGKDIKKLHRMGILTGLAIGIHNFPEGLATFVATLASPSLGIALAIAIALHNIPEGVCVSMPVYYATGSRVKGFMWAFLSGLSEPFGALLGWLVLKDSFGPLVYGISFGLVGGMMVFITLKELLPMAHRFDKSNGVLVSVFLVLGMAVMAASLLLFLY